MKSWIDLPLRTAVPALVRYRSFIFILQIYAECILIALSSGGLGIICCKSFAILTNRSQFRPSLSSHKWSHRAIYGST